MWFPTIRCPPCALAEVTICSAHSSAPSSLARLSKTSVCRRCRLIHKNTAILICCRHRQVLSLSYLSLVPGQLHLKAAVTLLARLRRCLYPVSRCLPSLRHGDYFLFYTDTDLLNSVVDWVACSSRSKACERCSVYIHHRVRCMDRDTARQRQVSCEKLFNDTWRYPIASRFPQRTRYECKRTAALAHFAWVR